LLTAWYQNGKLLVAGLVAGEKWSVYKLADVLVYEAESAKLPYSGIYIVKSGNRAVKVKYKLYGYSSFRKTCQKSIKIIF
jgi:hypothetical protein